MGNSFTALAYGVCARTSDLVIAGRAFSSLTGPMRALDQVLLLRRRGSLRTAIGSAAWSTRSSVEKVPDEIWELVRQGVIDLAVESERLKLMDTVTCAECAEERQSDWADELATEDGVTKRPPPDEYIVKAMAIDKQERKEYHREHVWNADWVERGNDDDCGCHGREDQWGEWSTSTSKIGLNAPALSTLLKSFGLYLPLKDNLLEGIHARPSFHTTILALKPLDRDSRAISSQNELNFDPNDDGEVVVEQSAVLDLSRAMFKTSAKSDARLARFLEVYHVQTETKSKMTPREGEKEKRTSKKKSDSPRWMLVHKLRGDPDWF